MGIRSFLYACDADPTRFDTAARGLCEHPQNIALAQLVMVTRGARAIESLLFEDSLAVLAERDDDRTFAFLAKLSERDVAEPERFALAIAQMQRICDGTPGSFVLLEPAEVHADREDVTELVASLADLDAQITRALAGEEEAWLDELRANWDALVMPWWANALYYNFESPSRWSRREVQAMLAPHDQKHSATLGHPFRYRLAPGLEDSIHLGAVVNVLPLLVADVEAVPDARVWTCELSVHEAGDMKVTF